ncbi:uracil-DNA glycosylase [Sporosalibacterium faouarense]|uniref:uracil-DNA glycosylase n=1 Tax=Sporosalibacterium faouarense TaxID=516123 RepID=UPI00192CAA44|nr:uracil-DNA glycosylase [Sporosalibacterium faouarense]
MNKDKRINCLKCKHFYVTWDTNNPRGCRYFGFKTRYIPSLAVYKSSGKRCKAFKLKK